MIRVHQAIRAFAMVGVLTGAIGLGACAQLQGDIAKINGTAQADLLKANLAIAKAEPTVAAFIQNHVVQADGYFQQVASKGVLSPAAIAAEKALVAKGNSLAGNLPTSAAGIAATLATIFTGIQNLTTVPGS